MSIASSPAEQRVILGNVSWSTYLALVRDADNPRGRMAYDRGVLEIMSPSMRHETAKRLIGRMVETFTFELDIEIRSVSSTTFNRADLEKGIEADECYYILNAESVHGIEEIDLAIHPPPDLAIEIDISRSSQIKMGIYAALQVGEIWRYDGDVIQVLVWGDGEYVEAAQSEALPQFPLSEAIRLLKQRNALAENELLRTFQASVRKVK